MRLWAYMICVVLLMGMLIAVVTPVEAALDPEDYNITKYDPKDDVLRVRTGGDFKLEDHNNVDIVKITSTHIENSDLTTADDEIRLTMRVEGTIQNSNPYKYAFALKVDSDVYIFAAYVQGQPVGIKLGQDAPLNPLFISASGANTNTLTITFDLSLLSSHSSSYDISAGAVFSVGDYERYIDLAPDKLVYITEPSDHSTLGSSVTVKGVIRESIDSKPGTDVKISIDGGAYEAVSGTTPWSYSTTLSDGEHTIKVMVEGSGVDNAEDEITITVNSNTGSYKSFNQKPSLNIGSKYEYSALDDADINGIEIPLATESTVKINDLTTITVNGKDYEVFDVWTNGTGGQDLGYVEFTNTIDKSFWREKDGFEIVKEYTAATNTATSRDPTTTWTTTTYSPPYDQRSGFDIKVGFNNKWSFSTQAKSESTTRVGSGNPVTNPPYTENIQFTGECLYYMSSMNVFGETYNDIYVIKNQLENPGVYVVEYYSLEIDMSVKIETYDLSRNLLVSLGLQNADIIPFSVTIDDVTFDPVKPKAGSDNNVIVKVKNVGGTNAQNVKVTLKDGDNEVTSETISSISAGSSESATIKWKPSAEGTHSLTVILSYQGDELTRTSISQEVEPGDSIDNGPPWILILIVIIIVVVIVLVLLMKMRGKKAETIPPAEASQPTPQAAPVATTPASGVVVKSEGAAAPPAAAPKPQAGAQIFEETIQCPKCKNGFKIQYKSKPFKVKCPKCGMEGVMN